MIRWRGYVLWGAVAYLWFLGINLPMGWLYTQSLSFAPPMQWTLLRGTPWSGQAEKLTIGKLSLGHIHWQFLWQALWKGQLSMDVQWGDSSGLSGNATVGVFNVTDLYPLTLSLKNAEIDLSLAPFSQQWPQVPPGSTGQIHVTLDSLVIDVEQRQLKQLQSVVELSKIEVGSPLNLPLGDFEVQAQLGEKGEVRLEIQDRQAALKVKANLQWHPNGQYRIRGTLAPQNSADERMISLLRLVGNPGLKGQVALDFSGILVLPVNQ